MRYPVVTAIVALMLVSCGNGATKVKEIKDKEFALQVSPLKDNDGEDLSYKARLVFDKQTAENMTMDLKNKFYYKMDSCFYTMNKGTKQYALLVQPIANGINGSYEYLLQFGATQTAQGDSISIYYQDRYTSHKQYQLKVSKK